MRGICRRLPLVAVVAALAAIAALTGCSAHPAHVTPRPLPTDTGFDYQLGGSYSPAGGVTIVTRDSTARPAPGLYNICYISGFQTQSQDKQFWLTKHPTLVLRSPGGTPVSDPDWPDELILDVSTPSKRAGIAQVMDATIDGCGRHGFDAVEFDNLDSYSRSQHAFGLGADITVAEECVRFDECDAYTRVYGARVLDIEYTDNPGGSFARDCATSSRPAMTILRDVNLVPRGSTGYVYARC